MVAKVPERDKRILTEHCRRPAAGDRSHERLRPRRASAAPAGLPPGPWRSTPAADSRRSALPSPASRPPRTTPGRARSIAPSRLANRTPPAVEIARSIGRIPVSRSCTALIRSARGSALDTSRTSDAAAGDSPARRSALAGRHARAAQPRRDRRHIEVRPEIELQHRLAARLDRVAQGGGERVDRPALEPVRGHDRLAPHRGSGEGGGDALQRLTLEAAERLRPGAQHPGIGRPQRCDGDARTLQQRHPGRHPSRAAARTRRPTPARRRPPRPRPRRLQSRTAADPRPNRSSDARSRTCTPILAQPLQPGAQQRRRLPRPGKHPAAAADHGRLAQCLAPGTQRRRAGTRPRPARSPRGPGRSGRGSGRAARCG